MEAVPTTSYASDSDHVLTNNHVNNEDSLLGAKSVPSQRQKHVIRITYRTLSPDISKITSKIGLLRGETFSLETSRSKDEDKKTTLAPPGESQGLLSSSSGIHSQNGETFENHTLITTTINFNRMEHIPREDRQLEREHTKQTERDDVVENNSEEEEEEEEEEERLLDSFDSDEENDENDILEDEEGDYEEDVPRLIDSVSILSHDDVMPMVDITSDVRAPQVKDGIVTAFKKRYHTERVGGGYRKAKGPGKAFFPHRIFAVSMSRYEDAMTVSRQIQTRQWRHIYDELKRHLGVRERIGNTGDADIIPKLFEHLQERCDVCRDIRKLLLGNTGKKAGEQYFPVKAADRTTFWKYVHGKGAVAFEDDIS